MNGGKRDLVAVIGCGKFVKTYIDDQIGKLTKQIEWSVDNAQTQPHATYAGFVHCVRGKFTVAQRTMESIKHRITQLENAIRNNCLTSLISDNVPINDDDILSYALHVRFEILGINNPCEDTSCVFSYSLYRANEKVVTEFWKQYGIDEGDQSELFQ